MKLFPDQEAHDRAIRPDLGPYCERGVKNPLINEAIKIIEEENRELKSRVRELESENARLRAEVERLKEEASAQTDKYLDMEYRHLKEVKRLTILVQEHQTYTPKQSIKEPTNGA